MENLKQTRLLEIFYRCLKGEELSVKNLALEYKVSTKTISRDFNDLKAFLADKRELVGNIELVYSAQTKCYHLHMDDFLTNKELFSLLEVIIASRAFSKEELLTMVGKIEKFTTDNERPKLKQLIRKELYHYSEVKHDCSSVQDMLWKLADCITEKKEITIEYFRIDRAWKTHRIRPVSVMFADHYFYLIAFLTKEPTRPTYFRIDRIKSIVEHRRRFTVDEVEEFDEGLLRERSLFMWPGKLRTIQFEYSGPSVQAVLDKVPTAKIIERQDGKYVVEAEVYGDGIKMWILSQGEWVKVVAPEEFVDEVKAEIVKMLNLYNIY